MGSDQDSPYILWGQAMTSDPSETKDDPEKPISPQPTNVYQGLETPATQHGIIDPSFKPTYRTTTLSLFSIAAMMTFGLCRLCFHIQHLSRLRPIRSCPWTRLATNRHKLAHSPGKRLNAESTLHTNLPTQICFRKMATATDSWTHLAMTLCHVLTPVVTCS